MIAVEKIRIVYLIVTAVYKHREQNQVVYPERKLRKKNRS